MKTLLGIDKLIKDYRIEKGKSPIKLYLNDEDNLQINNEIAENDLFVTTYDNNRLKGTPNYWWIGGVKLERIITFDGKPTYVE